MPPAEPQPIARAWTVLVLAAGRGRRMGGPKALMPVRGRPWWQTQEERLAAAGLDRVWVVSPEVAHALGRSTLRTVVADGDAPMFASLRAGLAAVPRDRGVFVLPVDVPAPDVATFGALARAATDRPAIPAYRQTRGHPVALPRPWIERVLEPAVGPDQRLDRLIGPDAVPVAVTDPAVSVNLNTPEDVDRWSG